MPKQVQVERRAAYKFPFDTMDVDDWFEHPRRLTRKLCDQFRSQASVRGAMLQRTFSVSAEQVSARSMYYRVTVKRTA
jgi:hypothetical protein